VPDGTGMAVPDGTGMAVPDGTGMAAPAPGRWLREGVWWRTVEETVWAIRAVPLRMEGGYGNH